jgi:hypothetical protein
MTTVLVTVAGFAGLTYRGGKSTTENGPCTVLELPSAVADAFEADLRDLDVDIKAPPSWLKAH